MLDMGAACGILGLWEQPTYKPRRLNMAKKKSEAEKMKTKAEAKKRARAKRVALKELKEKRERLKSELADAAQAGDSTKIAELARLLDTVDSEEKDLNTKPTAWRDGMREIQLDDYYSIVAQIQDGAIPECSGTAALFYDETTIMACQGAFVNMDTATKCLNAVIAAFRSSHKVMVG